MRPAGSLSAWFWHWGGCANLAENVVHALANSPGGQFGLFLLLGQGVVHAKGTRQPIAARPRAGLLMFEHQGRENFEE